VAEVLLVALVLDDGYAGCATLPAA